MYLALITDACSRKIVGWDLSRDLSSAGALRALQMALRTLPEEHSLIHHSDRGVQYCHQAYIKELNKRNILISMTESGDPLENALAERVNGILKTEWLDKRPLRNWSEAQAYVEQIIGLYNSLRPHQSLSFLTPDLVHRSGIATQRKWKNYPSQSKGEGGVRSIACGGGKSRNSRQWFGIRLDMSSRKRFIYFSMSRTGRTFGKTYLSSLVSLGLCQRTVKSCQDV